MSRGAAGWQIGVSWTMFAVPFVVAARPSGWLADHMDRRALVLGGLGLAMPSAPPTRSSSVPALMVLGATEALGFAAALPSLQSLLTQGSERPRSDGSRACSPPPDGLHRRVRGRRRGVRRATWLPFVPSAITTVALVATALVWRTVAGHVQHREPELSLGSTASATDATATRPAVLDQAAGGQRSNEQW